MDKTTSWITLIYGIALIFLGYLGYAQGNSVTSFRMGSIFGLLVIASSLAMFKSKIWGLYAGLGFTFLLTAIFALRYSYTGKTIPGALAVMSGGMLLFLLTKISKWNR